MSLSVPHLPKKLCSAFPHWSCEASKSGHVFGKERWARAAYKQRGISSISGKMENRCRSCKSQGIDHVNALPPRRTFFAGPLWSSFLVTRSVFRPHKTHKTHKIRNTKPDLSYSVSTHLPVPCPSQVSLTRCLPNGKKKRVTTML